MSAIHLFSSKSRDIDICFEYVKNVLLSSKQCASSILFIYDFFSFFSKNKRKHKCFLLYENVRWNLLSHFYFNNHYKLNKQEIIYKNLLK